MKNILHLFKRDVQNVSRSVIGLVVVMGLIIVPCLYAWFNIAGSWDPYGNTGNLKIAVVNTDEGYESDLIPVEVNVGENVTSALRGNENFDWVVLNDRDKAIEGVKSGTYYAAVVIPKSFSADMMTLFSTDVKHADIEFYENQKANAIAQIVTEKGSSAVQSQVNETFTETITSIGLKTVSSLLDYMSTDQVSNFIANLSSTLGDSVQDLQDVQASATSLAGILSSTSDSLTSAGGMLQQTGTVDESTKQLMEHAKSGMSDSKEALKAANDAIDAAIDGSTGSFDNVSAELAKAFDAANQHVDLTVSQLNGAAAALNARAKDIDATADQLRGFAEQVSDEKLQESLKSAATSLGRIAVEYRNNAKDLAATAKSLSDSMAEVNNSRAEVDQAIADAKAFCDSKGIKYIEKNGTTTAEVQMAAEALVAAGVKAVFTPTDNTVMTAELSIYETFLEAGIQHFTGADSFALNGAFVGYGVDYVQLGEATADMVVELLCGGKTPADLPYQTFDNGIVTINTESCEALGLDLDTVKEAFKPYCTEIVVVTTQENF